MKVKLLFVLLALVNFQNTFSQVFDNELINNQSNREASHEIPYLDSPNTMEVDVNLNPVSNKNIGDNKFDSQGMSIDEISALAKDNVNTPQTFDSPMGMVSRSEIIENQNRIE